jgi:hypothetical protein
MSLLWASEIGDRVYRSGVCFAGEGNFSAWTGKAFISAKNWLWFLLRGSFGVVDIYP